MPDFDESVFDAMTDEADRLCGVVAAPREREPRPAEATTKEKAKVKA